MLKLDEEKRRLLNTIGDPSRLKILLSLWKSGEELRVYKICRYTGLGRSSTRRHLQNLVESGLVSRKIYGEIPLYTINRDDFRARGLIEFFIKTRL